MQRQYNNRFVADHRSFVVHIFYSSKAVLLLYNVFNSQLPKNPQKRRERESQHNMCKCERGESEMVNKAVKYALAKLRERRIKLHFLTREVHRLQPYLFCLRLCSNCHVKYQFFCLSRTKTPIFKTQMIASSFLQYEFLLLCFLCIKAYKSKQT